MVDLATPGTHNGQQHLAPANGGCTAWCVVSVVVSAAVCGGVCVPDQLCCYGGGWPRQLPCPPLPWDCHWGIAALFVSGLSLRTRFFLIRTAFKDSPSLKVHSCWRCEPFSFFLPLKDRPFLGKGAKYWHFASTTCRRCLQLADHVWM